MRFSRCLLISFAVLFFAALSWSKQKAEPVITMMWPDANNPTLKLVFGRFVEQGAAYGGQRMFVSDIIVQNVSPKRIPRASLTLRFFDKDKVRIGDSVLNVTDLGPSESTKIAFDFRTSGLPAAITLGAHNDTSGVPTSLKTIPLKIVSVPPGARLKVDGQDAGTAPKVVDLLVGTHILEFSKEGYANGSTPVDIAPDEAPGGSITFELGGISLDAVELRDGTSLLGDVMSVSMTSIVVRINGEDKTYDRNQVRKITLVQRQAAAPPATLIPAPASK